MKTRGDGVTREKGEEMKTEIERNVERESVHETHVWGVQGHTHTHTPSIPNTQGCNKHSHAGKDRVSNRRKEKKLINKG